MIRKELKRTLLFAGGVLFIVAGLIGLVLPFLQGILFIAIGFLLLSFHSPTVREWIYRYTVRFPKIHETLRKIEDWALGVLG